MERAKRIFIRYGVLGMAVVGPLIIGTQIAAVVWGVATGLISWVVVA